MTAADELIPYTTVETEVWNSYLNASCMALYRGRQARRYEKFQTLGDIFLGVTATSTWATLSFLKQYPELSSVLAVSSAILAVGLPILGFTSMTEKLAAQSLEWSKIGSDYKLFWLKVQQGEATQDFVQSLAEYSIIMQKELVLVDAKLPEWKGMLDTCQQEICMSKGFKYDKKTKEFIL